MGYTRNQMDIDSEALRSEIKSRHLRLEKISTELGYSKAYMNNCLLRGKMPVAVSRYLDKVYEIPVTAYKVGGRNQSVESAAGLSQAQIEWSIEKALQNHKPIDYERLYKVIYSAVYEALQMPAKEAVNAE